MSKQPKRSPLSLSHLPLLVCLGGALLLFAANILICSFTQASPMVSGLALLAVYVMLVAAAFIFHRTRLAQLAVRDAHLPALGNLMMEMLVGIDAPFLITDELGGVIWYNRALLSLTGRRDSLYGGNMTAFCPFSINELLRDERMKGEGVPLSMNNRHFRAKTYRMPVSGKDFWLTVFDEETALVAMAAEAAAQRTVVAHIMLDNLEELAQYVRESLRSATNEVDRILKAWASGMHGVLTETDRNRYVLIFPAERLEACIADRFAIFDEIRNVRIGENGMPITVSMGISALGETLEERAQNANAALDIALQRGGDQVALKTEEGVSFYGGRTKMVQKRTKVRARIISGELCSMIASAGNVLIMGHRYPDFDAIGACVGVARLCMFCGVKAKIVLNRADANVRTCLSRISDVEEYEDVFIDGASGLDLVRSDTLLIVVDVNNFDIVEAPEIAANVQTIAVIDHHRKTVDTDRKLALSYIEPSASSACELIAEILEQCLPQGGLLKEEANLMMSGMLLDTKQFSANTGTRTFSAALYLRSEGANPGEVQSFFKADLDEFVREARFASNVVIYRNMIAIAYFDGEGQDSDRVAAAKAANKLLTVRRVAASFALVRIGDTVHISARSDGSLNVQLIMESMGGGGHFDGAGAQVETRSVTDAMNLLKSAIDGYLDAD
ncbi:MAG: DHH family phosphoesterase [Clostridia bacterium]|nr:DHH family phosphoesterase [Clostridia bacterium]